MPVYKALSAQDIKTARSFLNQLVDVIQESVSASNTRKAYEVFVTGSGAASVTSSIFQTVFDQDFTLATANEMFDITVGLYTSGGIVTGSPGYTVDSAGKLIFAANTLMMREKVQIYNQMAQALLGDSTAQFKSPFTGGSETDKIDAALFLPFKRLFARDKIKPETFAMKLYTSAALDGAAASAYEKTINNAYTGSNINYPVASGSLIITDAGAGAAPEYTYGGTVANLVKASDTNSNVGLIFYDYGVAVLDMEKVFWTQQHMSGIISAVTSAAAPALAGTTIMGHIRGWYTSSGVPGVQGNPSASFIPDFIVSGSVDDIVNHIASVRFGNGTETCITFQNITTINSTLVFCEAAADEFNYSSNPTFTDDDGRIVVIDEGAETTQDAFTFVTTIGLYDAADNLLGVAKLSRPVEKNNQKKLSFRVRLDY